MKPVVSAEYLLAELRCAALRARLWQADIEAVGVALRGHTWHKADMPDAPVDVRLWRRSGPGLRLA
jgi:hypothetical protein